MEPLPVTLSMTGVFLLRCDNPLRAIRQGRLFAADPVV